MEETVWRACCITTVVLECALSYWKSTSPFCRRIGNRTGLTICAIKQALFTLPCWNTKSDRVVTDGPPYHYQYLVIVFSTDKHVNCTYCNFLMKVCKFFYSYSLIFVFEANHCSNFYLPLICVSYFVCFLNFLKYFIYLLTILICVRRAGSDGSMSASGSAGPGFDPWRGSKF